MKEISYIASLDGPAARLKIGRPYIQAADMISFLEEQHGMFDSAAMLKKVEFHNPLENMGVLLVRSGLEKIPQRLVSVTGIYEFANDTDIPFIIFPSPVEPFERDVPFPEDRMRRRSNIDSNKQIISAQLDSHFHLSEHISSMMKWLCREILPHYKHWWFVRMNKKKSLPLSCESVTISVVRIIANRMVTAEISTEQGFLGTVDFVGGSR